MASRQALLGRTPYRAFHIGFPGSGKTGAIAALADVGYKIRMLDFEGNFTPLIGFTDERADIDVVTLQDRLRNGDKYIEPLGVPEAFNDANRMMIEWKYKDEDGNEVNLGKSAEWGPDTVVVIDSGSSLAQAVFRRAMKMNNKTPSTITSSVWGHAVADYNNFINLLKHETRRYHLIINVHKQMLGPQDFIQQGDDEAVKEKKLELINDGMIPTRFYPIAVTKPQAQSVHGMLPTMLEFEKKTKLGKDVRVIKTVSGPEIDVKIPGKNLKGEYPIETGLAEIFAAMGYTAPGFK